MSEKIDEYSTRQGFLPLQCLERSLVAICKYAVLRKNNSFSDFGPKCFISNSPFLYLNCVKNYDKNFFTGQLLPETYRSVLVIVSYGNNF